MTVRNIGTLMAFRAQRGRTLTVNDLQRRYPVKPLGTLTYYGFVDENAEYLGRTGRALRPEHWIVIDGLLASLYGGYSDELSFQLVVEATQGPRPYAYVSTNIVIVDRLAEELATYQAEARAFGKRLNVILRFGSEMNDRGGTAYADDPKEFVSAFRAVRTSFDARAPGVLFPFSPALRADLDPNEIDQYWPGSEYVDLVGATWYVHGERQRKLGIAHMKAHFEAFAAKRKPFSLDEFGGAEGSAKVYCRNDAMLKVMFKEIAALGDHGILFEYATIFLDAKQYGVDAKLRFLTRRSH